MALSIVSCSEGDWPGVFDVLYSVLGGVLFCLLSFVPGSIFAGTPPGTDIGIGREALCFLFLKLLLFLLFCFFYSD